MRSPTHILCGLAVLSLLFPHLSRAQNSAAYFATPALAAGQSFGNLSALQPDGKVLVDNGTVRLNPDGSVDPTYSLQAPAGNIQVGVAPSGDIIVSSEFGDQDSTNQVTECNPDGSVAQVLLTLTNGFVIHFAVQSDGKVIVWNNYPIPFGSITRPEIARINPDGSLDTSFDPGFGPNESIAAVALQSDGKIIVGGYFTTFDQTAVPGLVRLNANGTVDTSFTASAVSSGFVENDVPTVLTELPSGQMLAFYGISRKLVRMNSDGSAATLLGAFSGQEDDVNAVALQPDGKVLLGGSFSSFGSNSASNVIRLNADGTFDVSFKASATLDNLQTIDITHLAVDSAGHIYLAAYSAGEVRLEGDGTPDLSFSAGTPVPGQVIATARSPDGRVFVAGTFVSAGGSARLGLAAFHTDGSLDPTFAPTDGIAWQTTQSAAGPFSPSAQLVVLSDGSVLLAGSFNSVGATLCEGIAHFFPDGSWDTSFNPIFNSGGSVDSLAVLPSGEWVIGGSFSSVNGSPRSNLAGFTPGGILDPAFAILSGTNGAVTQLAVRPSGGLFLAGTFTLVGSSRADLLAALNPDGSLDPTFAATGLSAGTQIQFLAPMADGRLLIVTGTRSVNSLVRLLPSGSTDLTYTLPNLGVTNFAGAAVTSLAVDSNGRAIVGVTEASVAPGPYGHFGPTTYSFYLIRFDTDGTLDPLFVADGQQSNAAITSLAVGSDGLLVAGGSFPGATLGMAGVALPNPSLTVFDGGAVDGLFFVSKTTTGGPTFSTAPSAAAYTVSPGSTTVLTVSASGAPAAAPLTYQWYCGATPLSDGNGVTGSQTAALILTGNATMPGSYVCLVANSAGSLASQPITLTVDATDDIGRLVNGSCRAGVGSGSNILITGFAVGGGTTGSEPILARVSGPALTASFGLTGTLPDPQLALYAGSTLIGANQGWAGNPSITAAANAVGAFPWADPSSPDSACLASLGSGAYTVQAAGQSGDTGVGLAEIYDTTPAGTYNPAMPRLVNLSARIRVGTGASILIDGFVIGGSTARTVLIRASGPALAETFNLAGTLSDPQLQLFGGSQMLVSNTGWAGSGEISRAAAAVGAFPWTDPSSGDSAILITLPPGAYTAQVSGASGDTGVALLEVYEVP